MAPVKRSTAASAQRETRATRATRATATARKVASATEKLTSKVTPAPTKLTATRKTRKVEDVQPEAQEDDVSDEEHAVETIKVTKPTRATRANPASSTSLSAAPRRRVKVTPLDAPVTTETKPTRATSKKTTTKETAAKKVSTRSKTTISDIVDEAMGEAPAPEPVQTKPTRKTASKSKDTKTTVTKTPAKTRGRPKSEKKGDGEAKKASKPSTEPEEKPVTRATRSQRAESIVLPESSEIQHTSQESRPAAGVRKKVTFQDLPQENDKENQPLPQSKARKGMTKKKEHESTTAATGLRARPAHRAVTSTTSTRGRKAATSSTRKPASASASADDTETTEKKIPRALTPKKITQVAKSSSPENEEEEEESDEDDVLLNSGKTPVRDLSVSPRRPTTTALARALSPSKKLDFGTSLAPKSPDRTAISRDTTAERTGTLSSPARRAPASPFKDSLKDSPKRGLHESAKSLFPLSQNDASASIVLNPTNPNKASHTMSTMLQSPKRAAVLDPSFFSQSAIKKSVSKSPFKASLLGSPAKRLFVPTKKVTTPSAKELVERSVDEQEQQWEDMNVEEDITVSSHFRQSSSPLRVHRVQFDEGNVDFDDSVLQVRSPLKVQKSPSKQVSQTATQQGIEEEDPFVEAAVPEKLVEPERVDVVAPSDLDMNQDSVTQTANDQETAPTIDVPDFDISAPKDEMISVSSHDMQPDTTRRASLNQVLFRSNGPASENDTSEDELAGEKTPMRLLSKKPRRSTSGIFGRSRVSAGPSNNENGKGFGFTPLAAQMSGWLASSPEKSPQKTPAASHKQVTSEFSPLARQHIDGEVVISRRSTPAQISSKRLSLEPMSSAKSKSRNKTPIDLRKSLAQRQSLGLQSISESPARNAQFEEYMEIRAMEEQADTEAHETDPEIGQDVEDFDGIMNVDGSGSEIEDEGGDTILVDEDDATERIASDQNGDLTTDLINFTHASDTAMVDFQKLAEEANELASDAVEEADAESTRIASPGVAINDVTPVEGETTMVDPELFSQSEAEEDEEQSASEADVMDEPVNFGEDRENVRSPLLQPTEAELDSPSIFVIDQSNSPVNLSETHANSVATPPAPTFNMITPKPNLRLQERRVINTVVSKVPLKPEGDVSPIKVTKKRSYSFDHSETSPAKRMSFEDLRAVPSITNQVKHASPDRRVRTSTAPSPGGTSTPATTRSNKSRVSRVSFGGQITGTTPGQMSFAVDEFGDSTLDGIELPNDELDYQSDDEVESLACASNMATPRAIATATPATAKRSTRKAKTPATATKKTPATSRKTPGHMSTNMFEERTPLQPVGKGVLHGAVVFVDVHTSEGADASGVFVELLTQMGARCVKDWRWNPRASFAPDAENNGMENKIGITHVVYKDGGKRTLEKVRDTKGEVSCVGVAWVLDCERENQWLDESNYTVDLSLLPRGGSRRRKSMEPRALLISNDGSVSTNHSRRSVSAEMSETMKRELVNTPARGRTPSAEHNKTTATTIHRDENTDYNEDEEDDTTNDPENQSTPTGFVSYDPKVAMTPGTPYLVSQGKKLIQMSAPPKQSNKSLFENDDDDEDEENEVDVILPAGNDKVVRDARKFRMKNLVGDAARAARRRRTLAFKPVVGSPLGR